MAKPPKRWGLDLAVWTARLKQMPLLSLPRPARPWIFLCLGSALLGLAFVWANTPPLFVLSSVLVAATWFAGGFVLMRHVGPSDAALDQPRLASRGGYRHARQRAGWGWVALAAAGTVLFFLAGTWALSQIPLTAAFVETAVVSASWTPLWLTVVVALVTGWGEETFFRGGLPRAWGRRGQTWSLLAYTVSTLFTGNAVLVLAAPILGVICQAVYNRTGRLAAAWAVHSAFSLGVVGLVPLLFVP
ncbi:CPBP family intramembrane glutamic endopeptidase [Galactobacter valiniphilus]|uniref:CPBP family intramembrane glutamic endopeptidase n=1 Tax=Galactobacter valiniphilus TaxID=2676122 RepID=UPI0037369A75